MAKKNPYPYRAIGRRKTSIARVYMGPGDGTFSINDRSMEDYFPRLLHRAEINKPFAVTSTSGKFFVKVTVAGGGISGQCEAIRLGISRALLKVDDEYRGLLKKAELLTRDPRAVERKKDGQAGARRRFQYSKR